MSAARSAAERANAEFHEALDEAQAVFDTKLASEIIRTNQAEAEVGFQRTPECMHGALHVCVCAMAIWCPRSTKRLHFGAPKLDSSMRLTMYGERADLTGIFP